MTRTLSDIRAHVDELVDLLDKSAHRMRRAAAASARALFDPGKSQQEKIDLAREANRTREQYETLSRAVRSKMVAGPR